MTQVVVGTRLSITKVGGLGEPLEVKELADGTESTKLGGESAGIEALETLSEVEPRRDAVDRDRNAGHGDRVADLFSLKE